MEREGRLLGIVLLGHCPPGAASSSAKENGGLRMKVSDPRRVRVVRLQS